MQKSSQKISPSLIKGPAHRPVDTRTIKATPYFIDQLEKIKRGVSQLTYKDLKEQIPNKFDNLHKDTVPKFLEKRMHHLPEPKKRIEDLTKKDGKYILKYLLYIKNK